MNIRGVEVQETGGDILLKDKTDIVYALKMLPNNKVKETKLVHGLKITGIIGHRQLSFRTTQVKGLMVKTISHDVLIPYAEFDKIERIR